MLGRPEFSQGLSRLLSEIGAVGRTHPARAQRRSTTSDLLDRVRAEDEAKYELLKTAREMLFDTKAHGTVRQLVEALDIAGVHLKVRSLKRREDVVRAFLQSASMMSKEDLQTVVKALGTSSRSPSDLQDWSRIILPKKHEPTRR